VAVPEDSRFPRYGAALIPAYPEAMTTMQSDATEAAVQPRAPQTAAWLEMLISSIFGLTASLVLSIDAIALAKNPNADLSCNISSKISCGTVGTSWQASLLGFPNAFLGLMFESVVIAFAIAGIARVIFPRWYMLGVQAIYVIAIVFAYWLFAQAYFVIGAMCPWCLLITITTLLVFTSMTRINIRAGNFGPNIQQKLEPALRYGVDIYSCVVIIAIIAAMVIVKYM
jgi:uncharacterized membrane protein